MTTRPPGRSEPASGQTVFHLHFHVIPRHAGVALRRHAGTPADQELLARHAARITEALNSQTSSGPGGLHTGP